jgi:hypothetical protein
MSSPSNIIVIILAFLYSICHAESVKRSILFLISFFLFGAFFLTTSITVGTAEAQEKCDTDRDCGDPSLFSCEPDPDIKKLCEQALSSGACRGTCKKKKLNTKKAGETCQYNNECTKGLSCEANECAKKTVEKEEEEKPPLPVAKPPCKQYGGSGKCETVATALGDLSTQPGGFIERIFAILLSLSGGVALFLIMKSGYQIITSQGKPESLQQGRDQLIATIVGLLFLIFSFVLLQTIGVDILNLPGFK